jgi:hypothetical protein
LKKLHEPLKVRETEIVDSLIRLSMVNSRLHDLVNDSYLWKTLYSQIRNETSKDEFQVEALSLPGYKVSYDSTCARTPNCICITIEMTHVDFAFQETAH